MSKRSAASTENINQDFCDFLLELADYEKNTNKNIHKYNAYRKAVATLARHTERIQSGEDALKLEGIGKRIADKIDEFAQTGKLRKLEEIRNDDTSVAINILTKVSGIGSTKAHLLVQQGIKTIEDLRKRTDKLNHHQQIGLKYFEDFQKKIPRAEIQQIESIIQKSIHAIDSKYVVTICGSYRRGLPESGDIDVLIGHPEYSSKNSDKHDSRENLQAIVRKLEAVNLITDTIALGDVKFMGVCKVDQIARRLDLKMTPFDQYHCAILYFTGSDMFNKEMRTHALKQGFTLNEYCLRPMGSSGVPGEPLPVSSEEEIFEYIDYPYKTPSERCV